MDKAFSEWCAKAFGPRYPLDAYTFFAAGWKAAMKAAAEIAERERSGIRNGGAINACKKIKAELEKEGS
jgi:hypothetical protein